VQDTGRELAEKLRVEEERREDAEREARAAREGAGVAERSSSLPGSSWTFCWTSLGEKQRRAEAEQGSEGGRAGSQGE